MSVININISSYAVRDLNGSIDHESTLKKFAIDLREYEAERELESSTIGAVIHKIFDRHLGKRLSTPFVVGEALNALNAQPENYKALTDKVSEFLRSSAEFDARKGKGGGVSRRCDIE